jgi:hypothetical protein
MNKFLGKWQIVEMEQWDQDYIDLVEPGYIEFDEDDLGEFTFGTVHGFLDCRIQEKSIPQKIEFSWDGSSENDLANGRGWAVFEGESNIYGMPNMQMHSDCNIVVS